MKTSKLIFRLVLATLREIFEESAYRRFLARTDTRPTAETYRAFVREKELMRARQFRCC